MRRLRQTENHEAMDVPGKNRRWGGAAAWQSPWMPGGMRSSGVDRTQDGSMIDKRGRLLLRQRGCRQVAGVEKRGRSMSEDTQRIGLTDAIEALHDDLRIAVERAAEHEFYFPVGSVDLEFQIGITKSADAKGGVRVWVVELGAGGAIAKESVQRVRVTLQAPVDENGNPVMVGRNLQQRP
jgi:hypothetical protein